MVTVKHKDLTGADLHENKPHTHPAAEIGDFDLQLTAKAPGRTVLTVGPTPVDYLTDGTASNVQIQETIDAIPA